MTDLLVKTIKKAYLEEKVKRFLQKCNQLRENYSNPNSLNLEKIVKILIPLKEDKLLLYYQMFKAINHKIEEDEKDNKIENINIHKNKKEVSQKSFKNSSNINRNDNLSNCNVSTYLSSQASNFIEQSSHNNNNSIST